MQREHVVLHLSLIDGIDVQTIRKIVKVFDECLTTIYRLKASDFVYHCSISYDKAQKIVTGLSNHSLFDTEYSLMHQHKITLLTFFDSHYPYLLKHIHQPPIVLYCKGSINYSPQSLAVVGARLGDSYGYMALRRLIPPLIQNKWTIVSGGARGIDAMAHEVTLDNRGSTVAILGSGLLKPYPSSNKNLFTRIADNGGAVLSSYSLNKDPHPSYFPARNRIIAGMTQGCLVIQASKKSGSLITAYYALQEGREVFAVPGRIDNELSDGCHKLIQDGATMVTSTEDIGAQFQSLKWSSSNDTFKNNILRISR